MAQFITQSFATARTINRAERQPVAIARSIADSERRYPVQPAKQSIAEECLKQREVGEVSGERESGWRVVGAKLEREGGEEAVGEEFQELGVIVETEEECRRCREAEAMNQ